MNFKANLEYLSFQYQRIMRRKNYCFTKLSRGWSREYLHHIYIYILLPLDYDCVTAFLFRWVNHESYETNCACFIHFLNTETQRIVLNFVDYQFLRFYTTIFLVASPRGIEFEYQRQITKVANNSKCKSTFKSCRLWSLTDQSSLYCTLPRSEKVGILEITHAICILLTWMTE